jgi:hypothetical protein
MADGAVHLLAREDELDRAADEPDGNPFEPNPPPKNGLRMWMFSGGRPNNSAIRAHAITSAWLGVSIESVSPSQAATIACGSMALWYCAGVSYVASMRTGALASAAFASP